MTKNLKKHLSFGLLVLFLALALVGCAGSKYAAKVNDTYITREKLEKRSAIVINYYAKTAQKLTEEQQKEIRKEMLDHLINEELIAQEARRRGITGIEKQVDDYINNLKKNLGNDTQKFQTLIGDQGYTEENYRERLINMFLTRALSEAVTKDIKDPLAKKNEFDKFLLNLRKNSSLKIYLKFK